MEHILIFFLLHFFVMRIFYKLTDLDKNQSWLRDKTVDFKGDFLFKLASCMLCIESHIGFILSLPFIIGVLLYFNSTWWTFENIINNWYFIFIGYISSGLMQLIKYIKND